MTSSDLLANTLNIAVSNGDYEVAKTLLKQGADPDRFVENSNRTPFWTAVVYGQIEIIKLFLNISVGNRPVNDMDMITTAMSNRFTNKRDLEIAQLLIDHGANVDGYMLSGFFGRSIPVADLKSLYGIYETYKPPLVWCVQIGYLDGVKFLIKNKTDVNIMNNAPLKDAIGLDANKYQQKLEIIKILLDAGADTSNIPHIPENHGEPIYELFKNIKQQKKAILDESKLLFEKLKKLTKNKQQIEGRDDRERSLSTDDMKKI